MDIVWVIVITVLVLAVVGFVLGLLLGVAGNIFAVKKDVRVEQIVSVLPGANCGGCGFAGCQNYADAVVKGQADPGRCSVGGAEVAKQVAAIMGVEVGASVRMRAEVACSGDCEKAKSKYAYKGLKDCVSVAKLGNGPKECAYGCIGLGTCAAACPFGAIELSSGIARVDAEKCRACGVCVSACPQHIIQLVPFDSRVAVLCSSKDKGAVLRKYCDAGCIACGICAKNCPAGAITVQENVARIDYSLCTNCGTCAEKCPRKVIRWVENVQEESDRV